MKTHDRESVTGIIVKYCEDVRLSILTGLGSLAKAAAIGQCHVAICLGARAATTRTGTSSCAVFKIVP